MQADTESNSVYIDDVVREKRMHFFKIPKLGSYFAILLNYTQCLNQNAFSKALKDRIECDNLRKE